MDDAQAFLDATEGYVPAHAGSPSPDAAATDDAAEPDLLGLLMDAAGVAPAHEGAPDAASDEADPLAAEEDADAESDEEDEEALSPEEERAALLAEVEELRQARRDAEAEAATERSKTFWSDERAKVDGKLRDGVTYFLAELEKRYDKEAWAQEYLPRLLTGYTNDLQEYFGQREQAWEQIARKHGSQTYAQKLQTDYGLSADDMRRISKYPPEMWTTVAADLLEVRETDVAPVKRELTTTKGKLTKAQRANQAARLSQMPSPGSGRGTPANVVSLRDRITEDNAGELTVPLFQFLAGSMKR